MTLKSILAAAMVCATVPIAAIAAVVTPSQDVTFKLDMRGIEPLEAVSASYDCGSACGSDFGLRLFYTSTVKILYGTSRGTADLGRAEVKNPYRYDITNITWAGLLPGFSSKPLDTVFATFRFVDDVYHVDTFELNLAGGGAVAGTRLAAVPLPAGLPLLFMGLAGLAMVGQRRKSA